MFWPKDRGEWGFWIGIAAFVLAYPFSLLANLTSGRLQNWWARRSQESLKREIGRSKERLALLKQLPLISETEDELIVATQFTHDLLGGIGYFALVTAMVVVSFVFKTMHPNTLLFRRIFSLLVLISVLLGMFRYWKSTVRLRKYRGLHSPRLRNQLETTIHTFEAELKKRE
jgi:hypothetical protein